MDDGAGAPDFKVQAQAVWPELAFVFSEVGFLQGIGKCKFLDNVILDSNGLF